MVEPTIGRTDYQEEVATLNGINLPYAAYCSELELPFPMPVLNRRPVVWRVRSEDTRSAQMQNQRSRQGVPRGGRVADAVARWNDPLPFIVQNLRRILRAVRIRTSRTIPPAHAARSKP